MLPLVSSMTTDADRRRLVVEHGERLQLAVVVDLEVLPLQIRHEPAVASVTVT